VLQEGCRVYSGPSIIDGQAMTAREGRHRRFLQEKYGEARSRRRGATSEIEQVSP